LVTTTQRFTPRCLSDGTNLETADWDAAHGRMDHEAPSVIWDLVPEMLFPGGQTSYQSPRERNRLVIGKRARRTVVLPMSTLILQVYGVLARHSS